MKKDEILIPAFELDINTLEHVQQLAGRKFFNQELLINFNGLGYQVAREQEIVELSIDHIGIKGSFYILYPDLQRMLGVNIKLLSKEYVEYIFTRNMGAYGIQFYRFVNEDKIQQLPLLMSGITKFQEVQCSIYFQANKLMIDSNFLSSRQCHWPRTLSLSLDFKLSELTVSVNKISELSDEDLVLLSNR
ncbi:hypothetical protein [Providencia burhodogranariea]|uniref:Uncharacterized protein n=1 Tax=Providencia burhodogranariea DSM 19968 TaxID=1141662 RepID=K8WXF8_9GAMM|nr:hypothetical protein [Providencia burhodogranariea]EKT64611.1 hypothetical protein OOA_02402 [Providencia burhodogranariea DSM 19968]